MSSSAARATRSDKQIEPLTDNKMVRLPGAAPGWTSPLQRRRSGAKRRASSLVASDLSAHQFALLHQRVSLDPLCLPLRAQAADQRRSAFSGCRPDDNVVSTTCPAETAPAPHAF
jgi:hypothetical protein